MNAWDAVAGALMLLGASFALAAAVGVLRFPDVLTRMHAATKPQVLGLVLVLSGAAVQLRDTDSFWMIPLTAAFQLMTAPVAAHLVGRLAYRSGQADKEGLFVDDLADRGPA
jgi:multicomponent Na+:H+ antiporter subunit G